MFTFYEDNLVTKEYLEKLEEDFNNAEGMARFGRWKAKMHYLNLQSYQGSGEHFVYLRGAGDEGTTEYCPCGLVIAEEPVQGSVERIAVTDPKVLKKLESISLHPLQLTVGHRNYDEPEKVLTAFTLFAHIDNDNGMYVFDVICQGCGANHIGLEKPARDKFLKQHNEKCG